MRRMVRGLLRSARDFALGVHTANGILHGVVRSEGRAAAAPDISRRARRTERRDAESAPARPTAHQFGNRVAGWCGPGMPGAE